MQAINWADNGWADIPLNIPHRSDFHYNAREVAGGWIAIRLNRDKWGQSTPHRHRSRGVELALNVYNGSISPKCLRGAIPEGPWPPSCKSYFTQCSPRSTSVVRVQPRNRLIPFNGATLFLLSRAGLRRFIHHPSSFSWDWSLIRGLHFLTGNAVSEGEFPPLRCRNTRGSNFNSIHSPCQMNNYLNSLFPSLSTPLKIHRSQSSRPTWRETVTLNVLNGD